MSCAGRVPWRATVAWLERILKFGVRKVICVLDGAMEPGKDYEVFQRARSSSAQSRTLCLLHLHAHAVC